MNKIVNVTFDITWNKGAANEVTKTVKRTLDFSKLSDDDILEYATRPVIIIEQAKARSKASAECPDYAIIEVSTPGSRGASKNADLIAYFKGQGLTDELAKSLVKMRGKDEEEEAFKNRIKLMIAALTQA